jgi:DNA-binding CsgD family transcriptional regulator
MAGVILLSYRKKKTVSCKHAVLLLIVVFLNMTIWAVEQLIYWEFELLSVSYLVSELLLLVLYSMMQDYEDLMTETPTVPLPEVHSFRGFPPQRIEDILTRWPPVADLTARELDVLRAILEDKKRKEIATELYVTEHTVKKHTANIFSKLGVSSRAELFARAEEETSV